MLSQPPSGGCVLKQGCRIHRRLFRNPAAFRRLCVETYSSEIRTKENYPAAFRRLCVETLYRQAYISPSAPAAFRRLCVETPPEKRYCSSFLRPPPSGGCVVLPALGQTRLTLCLPAAFRRLCVETKVLRYAHFACFPAAFRRLCVETGRYLVKQARHDYQPPSGGCVLKPSFPTAVCFAALQPPSGGCVLKPVRF